MAIRSNFLSVSFLALLSVVVQAYATPAMPNVVYILSDDVGWGDLTVHGGGELALEETTIAEGFKANGYRTGVFGKWHNGGDTEFGCQAFWFMGGSDFEFNAVKWTQKTRGVFRGGFNEVCFLNCVTDRSPPIHGQTPCLAAPGGGPQIGQPNDPPCKGHVVINCRFVASGDDAIAFFNASGTIRDCFIRDAFCRGILAANSPDAVLTNNTVTRCPVQQSKDYRMPRNQEKPRDPL